MIRVLLDAASLDAGELRLDVERHDLGELVGEVIEVVAPIAATRQVHIDRRVPAGIIVQADRERLHQVLSNLLGNAVKYSPANSVVAVSAERVKGELIVAVSDRGRGIEPEALAHVFDRFYTTARGQDGTGLGLFIAKALVEAHGGRIWVESKQDDGATFFVALPDRAAVAPVHATP